MDLAVADATVSTKGPSQILADFFGLTPDNIEVGVVLHAREGKLSELETYPLAENDRLSAKDSESQALGMRNVLELHLSGLRVTRAVRSFSWVRYGAIKG